MATIVPQSPPDLIAAGPYGNGASSAPGPRVILRAEKMSKRFGDVVAVDRLSLDVREGEVLGLLGPNGAGKTTCIRMLCGLLKPDSGSVVIDGEPMTGGGPGLRCRVGMCPQEIMIWEKLTCLEQLEFLGEMYGLTAAKAREQGRKLLRDMGLQEKSHARGATLSGGMKRRLNLALALIHDPAIVVLDEPEAGLDPQSRVMVREYVRSLARRKTVIVTTHNMDEADRVADRVAIVDHGALLVIDTPAALKSRVGEGDVLEVEIACAPERARVALAFLEGEAAVECVDHEVVVRALDAVNLLPGVARALTDAGCGPGTVRIRQNSLEDVFISLTGRRLPS